jgi:hypothetical protein
MSITKEDIEDAARLAAVADHNGRVWESPEELWEQCAETTRDGYRRIASAILQFAKESWFVADSANNGTKMR